MKAHPLGLLAVTVCAADALIVVLAPTGPWIVPRLLFVIHGSGLVALVMFAAALACSPIARFAPTRYGGVARKLRRPLGVGAALAALAHFAVAFDSPYVARATDLVTEPHLRSGTTTLMILGALAISSFPRILTVPLFKPLHRLAYLGVPLAAHHVMLSAHVGRNLTYAVALGGAALLLVRLVPRRFRGEDVSSG